MHRHKLKWIVFDADDTLLDFKTAQKKAFRTMLLTLGLEDKPVYLQTYHHYNDGLWRALERGEINKAELIDARFRLFCEHFGFGDQDRRMREVYEEELSKKGDLIPGARHLLQKLAPRYSLALASNGILSIQKGRLEASGIGSYFNEIIISEETGYEKPQKGFFDAMMEKMGEDNPRSVLFVGDSLHADMQGAASYGLLSCWYNPHQTMATLKVDYTVSSLGQIPALVEGLVFE